MKAIIKFTLKFWHNFSEFYRKKIMVFTIQRACVNFFFSMWNRKIYISYNLISNMRLLRSHIRNKLIFILQFYVNAIIHVYLIMPANELVTILKFDFHAWMHLFLFLSKNDILLVVTWKVVQVHDLDLAVWL